MTHLDLCSGIGGFTLAAGRAGFETIGFAETEPYCCEVLTEKWPFVINYGDIRTADFGGLRGRVTVLSAGVPCQPASLAGKRRGSQDERWLWEAVCDVVGCVEPTWCIFENPDDIVSLGEFRQILFRLESMGYGVMLFSVPASAVGCRFEGYRLFIVAAANSDRLQGRDTSSGRSPWSVTTFSARPFWPEPDDELSQSYVVGKDDGIPCRSHRIRCLGNAVVPAQVWPFFEAIAQVEK